MSSVEKNASLPLQTLRVENFRAFRELTIPRLGRVNLITGKNNVGKTALLEAIHLYAERGSPKLLRDLMIRRSEVFDNVDADNDALLFSFMSLFHMDGSGFEPGTMTIGEIEDTNPLDIAITGKAEITISINDNSRTGDLTKAFAEPNLLRLEVPPIPCRFVKSHDFNRNFLKNTLSEGATQDPALSWLKLHSIPPHLQDSVEKMLRIIEPRLEHLTYSSPKRINRDFGGITAQISDNLEPTPLESMGEGMIRLFDVGLALPDLQNGILLIDELENGLHYSVIQRVWEEIFRMTSALNIQVFATTHSWDCIEAFQKVTEIDEDPASGVLIRLRNKSGDVIASVYDEADLAIVTREGIEVR